MGYKLLGYLVWQVSKWYVRKRAREERVTLAVGAGLVVALMIAAGAATLRRGAANQD